jgi:hypothetical protein
VTLIKHVWSTLRTCAVGTPTTPTVPMTTSESIDEWLADWHLGSSVGSFWWIGELNFILQANLNENMVFRDFGLHTQSTLSHKRGPRA